MTSQSIENRYPAFPLLPPFVADWKFLFNSDTQKLWDRMNESSQDESKSRRISVRPHVDKSALGARETTIDILGKNTTVVEFLLPKNGSSDETVLALKTDCNISLITNASKLFEDLFKAKVINSSRCAFFRYLRSFLGCSQISSLLKCPNSLSENMIDLDVCNHEQSLIVVHSLDELKRYIFNPENIKKKIWNRITEAYLQISEDDNSNSNVFNSLVLYDRYLLQGQFVVKQDGKVEACNLIEVANLMHNIAQRTWCFGSVRVTEKSNNTCVAEKMHCF